MINSCKHEEFDASVTVNRLEDVKGFAADVRIVCHVCGKPFQFLGLPGGLAPDHPTVSVDRLEARLPIAPEPRTFPYPIGLPSGFSLTYQERAEEELRP